MKKLLLISTIALSSFAASAMEKPSPEHIAQLLQSHNSDARAFGNLVLARNLYFDGKLNEAKIQFTKCLEENNNNIWLKKRLLITSIRYLLRKKKLQKK